MTGGWSVEMRGNIRAWRVSFRTSRTVEVITTWIPADKLCSKDRLVLIVT